MFVLLTAPWHMQVVLPRWSEPRRAVTLYAAFKFRRRYNDNRPGDILESCLVHQSARPLCWWWCHPVTVIMGNMAEIPK